MNSDKHGMFQISHQRITDLQLGKPLRVTVSVTNPAGIKWVRLCYRSLNQDMEYQTIDMIQSSEANTYEAVVPDDSIDPKWDFIYFLQIMDNQKNGIVYPDLNIETPYIIVKLLR